MLLPKPAVGKPCGEEVTIPEVTAKEKFFEAGVLTLPSEGATVPCNFLCC